MHQFFLGGGIGPCQPPSSATNALGINSAHTAERGADVGGVLPLVELIHELSVHGPRRVDVPG